MDKLDFPFKTTFAAQIKAIEPSETEINEVKASLTDLKSLLPEGIDPEDNPQLLYIAANLYVAGMVNLNDDGVDLETSLAAYKGFEKQQINIEHDRKRIAGYILHAGISEFGTDRLITEDEARAAGKPFNVCVVAVLWKVANRELCNYLTQASSPTHPDYKALSLSFEVGFASYNIGIIDASTRIISEAKKVFTPADADYEMMSKRLRSNGGSGKMGVDSTEGVYQLLSGSFTPLGGGIVTMPAAAVKGIIAITEPNEPAELDDVEEDDKLEIETESKNKQIESNRILTSDIRNKLMKVLSIFENKSLSSIISNKTRVLPSTSQTINNFNMKSLIELKEKMASATKPEEMQEVVASVMDIAEAITKASEQLSIQLEAEKNRGAEIEKARAEATAANEELKKSFEAVKAEVDALKAAQLAADKEAQFNARMASLDEIFDLESEDRVYIIEEVKDLDEESFAKWMDKNTKVCRKEKTKAFKKAQKDEKQKKMDEMCAALKAKGVTVTIDENDLLKEVIASAKENIISDGITNTIEGSQSLKALVKEEFEEAVMIGGKKLNQFKKKE